MKTKKTLDERVFQFLGQAFAILLFIGTYTGILLYGLLHATTLN